MEWNSLMINFLVLTALVSGAIIFTLYRVFISSVEGAKQRLERDAESAREREAELARKIKEADEELESRRKELKEIEQKIRGDIEEEAQKEREDLINKAREEAEDVITKAQKMVAQLKLDANKEIDTRVVDATVKILNDVFSALGQGALDKQLIDEFLKQFKEVDMSRIDSAVSKVELVSAKGLSDDVVSNIKSTIKEKLGRDIEVSPKTDPKVIGGVVLQFDSMLLDGSLQKSIIDAAREVKQEIEKEAAV